MIKRYKQFLKESNEEYDLRDAIKESNFYGSYSTMCQNKNADIDKDFNTMQSEIDELGWSLDRIRKEYTNEELISLYRSMDDISGGIDMYFYKLFEKFGLDKNIVRLGGDSYSDIDVTEEEAFIRYCYGHHQTVYGKLAIEQIDGGLESFLEHAFLYLKTWLYENLMDNILSLYTSKNYDFHKLTGGVYRNYEYRTSVFDLKKYSVVEEDRMIIYANEIADLLNNLETTGGGKLSDIMEVYANDIYEHILEFLTLNNIEDVELVGNDVIIWAKFDQN